MIASTVERVLLALLTAVLILTMTQRRHLAHGERKRFATLGLAGIALAGYAAVLGIRRFGLPDASLLIVAAAMATAVYVLRERILIFSTRCRACGKRLPPARVLYHDDGACAECAVETAAPNVAPKSVEEIDWSVWKPDEEAVLCFIRSGDRILLIHKKTGLGAGKINAPGGRIEAGESPMEAAVRETVEEVCLEPSDLCKRADLSFQFIDGYSLHGSVFFASSYSGEMRETAEAAPFWSRVDEIPYERMWADDGVWLPLVLDGRNVTGRFVFDGDAMLSRDIEVFPFDGRREW